MKTFTIKFKCFGMVLALSLILAACATQPTRGWIGIPTGTEKLIGSIHPTNGSGVRGAGALALSTAYKGTHAMVSISGAEEGTQLPWKLHYGSCDQTGSLIGKSNDYPPFTPAADGNANVEVILPFALDMRRTYTITVQDSSAPNHTIACGELVVRQPAESAVASVIE